MNQLAKRHTMVKGSVAQVATSNRTTLGQAIFDNVEVLLMVDRSYSMTTNDGPDRTTRFDQAIKASGNVQREHPGKVLILQFDDEWAFKPNGYIDYPGGGTDITGLLHYIKRLGIDDMGIKLILTSDGEDNADGAVQIAEKFNCKIHTIFCGAGGGSRTLDAIAKASGGASLKTSEPGLIGAPIAGLLEAPIAPA